MTLLLTIMLVMVEITAAIFIFEKPKEVAKVRCWCTEEEYDRIRAYGEGRWR